MTDAKLLAIDFGTKRIGLAVNHGSLAEPFAVIANDDQTLEALKKICEVEKITGIVVGLSENTMAELTKQFAKEVEAATGLLVNFTDETLSSYTATEQLKAQGKTSPRQRPVVDSIAAAMFLQEYLDV